MAKSQRKVGDSGAGERIDQQLARIARNIVEGRDIRTRAKYWKAEFILYKGWNYWSLEKCFLPLKEDYDLIKKVIGERVYVKGIPDHPELSKQMGHCPKLTKKDEMNGYYYETFDTEVDGTPFASSIYHHKMYKMFGFIVRNQNNMLQIVFQNLVQLDFMRPDVVIFFRGMLYWITNWDYINNKSLYIKITCKRDVPWLYHGSIMSARGQARIVRSQLQKYRFKSIEVEQPVDPNNPSAGTQRVSQRVADYSNPWPDHCFDFCSDLRIEKMSSSITKESSGGKYEDTFKGCGVRYEKWQPKFQVMFADPLNLPLPGSKTAPGLIEMTDWDGKPYATLPNHVALKKYNLNPNQVKLPIFPQALFLCADFHIDNYAVRKQDFGCGKANKWEDAYKAWLPNQYNYQPHLIYHSTVQFYMFRKLITTVELKRCRIAYEGSESYQGANKIKKGEKHFMCYRVRVASSPSGIVYHFETGEIFFRCEIKVSGTVQAKNLMQAITTSMAVNMDNFLTEKGIGDDSGWTGAIMGTAIRNMSAKWQDKAQKWVAGRLKERQAQMLNQAMQGSGVSGVPGTGIAEAVLQWGAVEAIMATIDPEYNDAPTGSKKVTLKEAVINSEKIKGMLGISTLFDEASGEEQNTARMKSSTEGGSEVAEVSAKSYDRGSSRVEAAGLQYGSSEMKSIEIKEETSGGNKSSNLGKVSSPGHYYVNTISLVYDFFEFWSRANDKPFEIRFDYSQQLFDSICNNPFSSPAQYLGVRFNRLAEICRRGEIQADVKLWIDFHNEYKNAFSRGINFYTLKDLGEDYPVLRLVKSEYGSGVTGSGLTGGSPEGEEQSRKREIDVDTPVNIKKGGTDNTALKGCGGWVFSARGEADGNQGRGASYIVTPGNNHNFFHDFHSQIASHHWHSSSPVAGTWKLKAHTDTRGTCKTSIDGLEIKFRFVTYQDDQQNHGGSGREGDAVFIAKGDAIFTYSYHETGGRPDRFAFKLEINGIKREKKIIDEMYYKVNPGVPPDVADQEQTVPMGGGGGGLDEEVPQEEFDQQEAEGTEQAEAQDSMDFMDALGGQEELNTEGIDEVQQENVNDVTDELYDDTETGDEDETTDQQQQNDQSSNQDNQQQQEEQQRNNQDDNSNEQAD